MAKTECLVTIPVVGLIKTLDDDALSTIHAAVWDEMRIRTEQKIDEGRYETLNEHEQTLVLRNEKTNAVLAYKRRTGHGIYLSRAIVERFIDKRLVIDIDAPVAATG